MKPARTAHDRQRQIKRAKKRVTADLPPTDYARLDALRGVHHATTTDVVRGYLMMHETDPEMGEKLGNAILAVRMGDLQATGAASAA